MILSLLLSASLAWSDTNYPIPQDALTLHEISVAPVSAIPLNALSPSFEMLVWNVHKGEDRDAWARDVETLSSGSDFILLQEGMQDSFMPRALAKLGMNFWMAKSFDYKGTNQSTGVISGFKVATEKIWFHRSSGREPLLGTPKMSLLSQHPLTDGRKLLMINIHGINFVGNDTFKNQINEILPDIRGFDGPVVFAGDFNTWNPGRVRFLTRALNDAGMKEVVPEKASPMRLDHIFQRGCDGSRAWLVSNIKTSDHSPLRARLNCGSAVLAKSGIISE